MLVVRRLVAAVVIATVCVIPVNAHLSAGTTTRGCVSGKRSPALPPIWVSMSGPTGILNTGASRAFSATVLNSPTQTVTWSVVEQHGGSITSAGVYTAPSLPGTFTVKAVSQADAAAFATVAVPVVIPVGRIPGYDVGVDYHATGSDFGHTAFITQYHNPAVRQAVLAQLQGMADRGATFVSTRIWFVTEPGTSDFGETWRATFPMSDQEQANLHVYAQDVATLVGSGGNRPRLDLGMLWLGAADYTRGSPATGLGWTPVSAATFTSRVDETTDRVLAAVTNVVRPDGLPVVDTIYLDGEVMIGAKPNLDWFLATHYPRFVSRVSAAGFKPAVYFLASASPNDQPLVPGYVDVDHPVLNGHRTMFWVYRSVKYMADHGLPLPPRIDFSCYIDSSAGLVPDILARVLDDADATLPSLGAARNYGAVETNYFLDDGARRTLGQAFAAEAARNPRMRRVSFWTAPDGGGPGIHPAYPFAIEDYAPPPSLPALPPTVTAVAPTYGSSRGGTSVTITGTHFEAGASAMVGGVAATNVLVVNDTTISAVTGPHAEGVVDLLIANPDGRVAGLAGGFRYGPVPPVVTWANPASIVYGTPLGAAQLNATANAPGTFVYTPAAGTVLALGTQTLSVTLVPADTVRYTTATAAVSLVVRPVPARHRVAIRVVNGKGEFLDTATDAPFVPRGNNYIRTAQMIDPVFGSVTDHSLFHVGRYDRNQVEADLLAMQQYGYNVVRVFLGPLGDGGIGDPAGGLSLPYLANMADFLDRASAHSLQVLLTAQALPSVGGYSNLSAEARAAADYPNFFWLTADGIDCYKRYLRDVIRGLSTIGASVDSIFGYEAYNEAYYDLGAKPFTTTASFTAPNGLTYDLALMGDRQRLMDDSMVLFATTMARVVREEDPSALVTMSFMPTGRPHPDSWTTAHRWSGTSYAAMLGSELDFIDLHPYPEVLPTLSQWAENNGLTGGPPLKPIIMGEYGSSIPSDGWSTSSTAAARLQRWQVDSCAYAYSGFLLWTWDGDGINSYWTASQDGGVVGRALAPKWRPDPCAPAPTPGINVAYATAPAASATAAGSPPGNATDGVFETVWSSGGSAPQWIEIPVAGSAAIAALRLTPAMFPSGVVTHRVWGRYPTGLSLLTQWHGTMSDGVPTTVLLDPPVSGLTAIRVETTESPSWIAWRDIEITASIPTPVITWANPASIVYGTSLGAAQLNATASVAGAFVYTPPAGTVLNVGAGQALSVTFTPTDATNYTTATRTVLIDVVVSTGPPVITDVTPASGAIGSGVTVTGSGFTGTTTVTFHGVSAAYTVVSDTQVTTTVPTGATTGLVRLTTPSGAAASQADFVVTNQRAARAVPGCYVPGYRVTASLNVGPSPDVLAQAVTDTPPTGWTVGTISGGGAWDAVNRMVKWGPFFDATARVLTYVVTPPAGTTGTVTFAGVVSFDGADLPVGGQTTLAECELHPADTNADWRIVIGEVTLYGKCWKTGRDCESPLPLQPPAWPIPISFVTRAGYLWRVGETYRRDVVGYPLCWAPLAAVPLPLPDAFLSLEDIPTPPGGPRSPESSAGSPFDSRPIAALAPFDGAQGRQGRKDPASITRGSAGSSALSDPWSPGSLDPRGGGGGRRAPGAGDVCADPAADGNPDRDAGRRRADVGVGRDGAGRVAGERGIGGRVLGREGRRGPVGSVLRRGTAAAALHPDATRGRGGAAGPARHGQLRWRGRGGDGRPHAAAGTHHQAG